MKNRQSITQFSNNPTNPWKILENCTQVEFPLSTMNAIISDEKKQRESFHKMMNKSFTYTQVSLPQKIIAFNIH